MSRPPPEPEEEGGRAIRPGTTRKNHSADCILEEASSRKYDRWLHRKTGWTLIEIQRLNAGQAWLRYWCVVYADYGCFSVSGDQSARYRAWTGIQDCCAWLSQLEGAQS